MRKISKILKLIPVTYLILMSYSFAKDDPILIPQHILNGFRDCNYSNEFKEFQDKLIKQEKPIMKEDVLWAYSIKGQFMGLSINGIQIGVCNINGERNCGFGHYIGLIINSPVKTVRNKLLKKYGIDFELPKRDKNFETTLRPVLSTSKSQKQTIFFCDSGSL